MYKLLFIYKNYWQAHSQGGTGARTPPFHPEGEGTLSETKRKKMKKRNEGNDKGKKE